MKKAYIILTTVLLLISPILYRPFKIKAYTPLSAPFLGVNINLKDAELITRATISGTASDNSSNRQVWRCTSYSNNACASYQTVTTDGATYTNQSTITFNNTSITESYYGSVQFSELEFVLDNDYIGSFTFQYTSNGDTYTNSLVVNGNNVKFAPFTRYSIDSVTITNVNLTLKIDKYSWYFPIESYPFIYQFFDNNVELSSINQYNQYQFPIFRTYNSNNLLFQVYIPTDVDVEMVCMMTRLINASNFKTYFNSDSINDLEITQVNLLTSDFATPNRDFRFCKITLHNTSNTSKTFRFYAKQSFLFMPIYLSRTDFQNISTDFALTFGLDNELLKNLDIIANGNNQSNESVSDSDSTNQQAAQTFAQEEQLVNNAEQDLQDNLDNLDIQNKNNNLFGNSKFVASAQWVKLQFDNLTNNNAFGYMITFSLVIGLALVIVGKLRG